MKTAQERFEEKYTKSETGCWVWKNPNRRLGYRDARGCAAQIGEWARK